MKNKIFFENKINNLKKESVKKYFLNLCNLKNILFKFLILLLLSVIIFSTCLLTRNFYLNYNTNAVVLNAGVGFSIGSSLNFSSILAIQLAPSVIALILFIFINTKMIYIPILFISFGGFCNVIDRFLVDNLNNNLGIHTVVDYFHSYGSIFNLPDVFVVSGSISFGLLTLIYFAFEIKKENQKNEQ